jgi:hypothetical protein
VFRIAEYARQETSSGRHNVVSHEKDFFITMDVRASGFMFQHIAFNEIIIADYTRYPMR